MKGESEMIDFRNYSDLIRKCVGQYKYLVSFLCPDIFCIRIDAQRYVGW